MVYLGLLLCLRVWWFLNRTRAGLILRAVGENHDAAHALGYQVVRIRLLAILFGGACAGLGGAYLSLVRVPQWTEGMTAGAGWIALAIVVFASWRPGRLLVGAYLFGGVAALQLNLQAAGVRVPVEVLSMSPYLVTILVLVLLSRRPRARARSAARSTPPGRADPTHPATKGDYHEKKNAPRCPAPAPRSPPPSALPLRAQDEPLKVGFIYVGPIGDGGWTYQHDQGRLAVEAEFRRRGRDDLPGKRARRPRCRAGADPDGAAGRGPDLHHLVRLHGGHHQRRRQVPGREVRARHRLHARHANVATYDARFYEGRAVIGTIAGRMTKSNKIGYIGSFPIPEVIQGINSSFLHASKVNPDVEMVVIWAYTWFDPAKEADAAKAMIEQGVDVILQHTDSTAPQAAAAEAGDVYTFGQASDMAAFKPEPRISSIIDNWAPYYIERVQPVMDGTWDVRAHLGRHRRRRGRDRRDHRGRARRGEGRGRGADRRDRRRARTTRSPARSTSRTARPGSPRARSRPTSSWSGWTSTSRA